MPDAPLIPRLTGREHLPDAVDLYDLIEIAEELGLDPTPAQLDALRWKLRPRPVRTELDQAA